MKKSKKLLIALLSATCLTAGAFGLAACGSAQDDALYKIYTEYVADAGDNAKSYEEWLKDTLENVGKPGDKGEQGKPGDPGADGKSAYDLYVDLLDPTETPPTLEEWLASLVGATGTAPHIDATTGNWFVGTLDTGVKAGGENGANGKGIKYIEMTDDGKGLLFTFTDDTTQRLTLPTAMTHVHTYGDEITVLLPVSGEHDGLGYKTCTDNDCEHIELVVMSCYKVKVTLADGKTPATGATVTIGTASAKVDATGYAVFPDVEYGEYDLTVAINGYVQLESVKTSATTFKYEVNLAKELTGTTLDALEEVGDTMTYYITAEGEEIEEYYGTELVYDPVILTMSVNELSRYKVSLGDGYDMVLFTDNSGVDYTSTERGYNYYIAESGTITISFEIDTWEWTETECSFAITLEKITPPVKGSIEYPVAFEADKEVSVEAQANTDVYFQFNGELNRYVFEFGENVTMTWLGADLNDPDLAKSVTSGEDGALRFGGSYYTYYFKAQATDGKVKFKITPAPLSGEKANPVTLQKDTQTTVDEATLNNIYSVWYKMELPAGNYTIETTEGSANFNLYDDISAISSLADINNLNKYPFKVEGEGTHTYYLKANSACTFVVRDYNSDTDVGFNAEFAKEITQDGEVPVPKNVEWWFKYTVANDGVLSMTTDGATFYVYSSEMKMLFNSRDIKQLDVTTGSVYYINAFVFAEADSSFGIEVIQKVEKVNYHFNVADDFGNALNGLTVTANKEGEEPVSGMTSGQGRVTLNLTPGAWTITVSELEGYETTRVVTKESHTESETFLTLKKLRDYVITAKTADGTPVEGITVLLMKGEGSSWVNYKSAVTDNNGKVTFKVINDTYGVQISSDGYTLVVSGTNTAVTLMKNSEDKATYEYDITVKANSASAELKLGENQVKAGTEYTLSVTFDDAFNIETDKIQSMICHTSSMGDVAVVKNGTFNSMLAGFVGVVQIANGVNIDLYTNDNNGGETSYTFTFVFSEDTTVNVSSAL